jgi:5'(3')-deoxyribonucleotidase
MNKQQKPVLYLDMDGVLADFNAAAQALLGATDSEQNRAAQAGRWPDHKWRQIADQQHFYLDLPKMELADQLVDLAIRFRENLDYEVRVLTAIPSGNDMPDAFHDKIDWMNRHYGELGIRVHFGPYSHDKARHCQGADDILVDDRTSNCEAWRAAGGTAIQVHPGGYREALIDLERIFHELMSLTLI